MHIAIENMLENYQCQTQKDYVNALKEIFQEIALLGLWRSKFFEHAAFYGGTALRILYGLDRFSEDMDFTLLKPKDNFKMDKYNHAISNELSSFGFDVDVQTKQKTKDTTIESAFVKANTLQQLINIQAPPNIIKYTHNQSKIQIKIEVDTDPPGNFSTEIKPLYLPIPFTVQTMVQEDLFAGKIHALLCRQWIKRVKGRDWYDLYWYISRNIKLNLKHLETRLVQSGHWDSNIELTEEKLRLLLKEKANSLDISLAKKDVIDFLKDEDALLLWSKEFFLGLFDKLIVQ